MAYALVEDGEVVQMRPDHREGFIEAPDHVVPGYLYNENTGEFSEPDTSPTTEQKIRMLKKELERIDGECHTDRGVREFIINNSSQFDSHCVNRMRAAENKAQKTREELSELTG